MRAGHIARCPFVSILCAVLIASVLAAAPAQAQKPSVIHAFAGQPGPSNPNDQAITQGRDGELYLFAPGGEGKAVNCTTTYCGELFKISTTGAVTDLFDMSNNSCPGSFCGNTAYGGLTLGADGNFHGATYYGGMTGNNGTVFKMTPGGVVTGLHNFTGGSDGSHPYGAPIQAANGVFYGTTTSATVADSTAYSITSTGAFKTLHTFTGPDGQNIYAPLVLGTDGNLYGNTAAGGKTNNGVIFKMTPSGAVTVLHSFTGTDGSNASYPLIEASDGNFYGTTYAGGTSGAGVIFRITPSGVYTVLYNLNGTTDGTGPAYALTQATNGKLYGVTAYAPNGYHITGTIYSITTSGTFATLYTFTNGADGGYPLSPMVQHTNGLLYGTTDVGGGGACSTGIWNVSQPGCGEVFSLDINAKPFINLSTYSGSVGSTVGIFGQGFDSASVVKFNGVKATKIVLSGTTYITATVPAGATDGRVTVTTGTTTLTSAKNFIVHNTWSTGKAMPTAVICPAVGYIAGKIYVVGGSNGSVAVGDNQVYNTANNTWSTAKAMPTPVACPAYAVVAGILYVIGGGQGATLYDTVQAYDPVTNTWTTKTPMPIVRASIPGAVVDGTSIYVMGGNGSTLRLDSVEKFDTKTDTWSDEAPLLVGRSETTAALLGNTIVSADGDTNSGPTGDTEAYDISTNKWSELTADPTQRGGPCVGAISGQLYLAGGSNPGAISLTESLNLTADKWTTQASMPNAVMWTGSVVANGQLYCFGGTPATSGTTADDYVQIYQP
jgi:uncharacterized repeat protein (TIGR03803 family)